MVVPASWGCSCTDDLLGDMNGLVDKVTRIHPRGRWPPVWFLSTRAKGPRRDCYDIVAVCVMLKNTGLRYLWSSNSELLHSRAQNGRDCGKWTENLVRIWIMSRSLQFPDPNLELKMDVSVVNGPKTWSEFGSCPGASHEFGDQKFELKMALPALNGPKSWSSFGPVTLSITEFRYTFS